MVFEGDILNLTSLNTRGSAEAAVVLYAKSA